MTLGKFHASISAGPNAVSTPPRMSLVRRPLPLPSATAVNTVVVDHRFERSPVNVERLIASIRARPRR